MFPKDRSTVSGSVATQLYSRMNAKSAGDTSRRQRLNIGWDEEVSFGVIVRQRLHTLTSLQATPMTLEYGDVPAEKSDCMTHTGNTEIIRRNEIPPAKAA